MPEEAETMQAPVRKSPLHSQYGLPSAQTHPANRPLVAEQNQALMGSERSSKGTLVAGGTFQRELQGVVGALILAVSLALCYPRPVLAAQQRKAPASRSALKASRGALWRSTKHAKGGSGEGGSRRRICCG
jgi:hypothetical protein